MVLVEWEDIATMDVGPWVDNKPIKKVEPHVFHTAGFLLYIDDSHVVVTACWRHDTTGPRDQIPFGVIRSITYLAPA